MTDVELIYFSKFGLLEEICEETANKTEVNFRYELSGIILLRD
jgi:hypothetical protein